MGDSKQHKIAIVAGEPSGDLLGAGLISEFLKIHPETQFYGVGGPKMQHSGCQILHDMHSIELMGLDELFSKVGGILKIRSSLLKNLTDQPPDLFIGIDVPDFNIRLEKQLRRQNIPTIHYVSPTVWAWRGYRIHKIRKAVSHMLVLFPFEKRYYTEQNIPVTCVGHPVADQIDQPDMLNARSRLDSALSSQDIVISVLPGSRGSEVRRLGGIFIETIRLINQKYPDVKFYLPMANQRVKSIFIEQVGSLPDLPVTIIDGQSRLAMEASNLVLLASGTAALEALLLERPHVVAYKISKLTWWFFKRLRHVDYYSMSNQLLQNPVVPELMQDQATPENLFSALDQYLSNEQQTNELISEFRQIRNALKLNASTQAAMAVNQVLGDRI